LELAADPFYLEGNPDETYKQASQEQEKEQRIKIWN
jgi:hypothetical protein